MTLNRYTINDRPYWWASEHCYAESLVIACHGAKQRADPATEDAYLNFPAMCQLHNTRAVADHLMGVIYPESEGMLWSERNDLEYILALYDLARASYGRVYFAGFSMGSLCLDWLVKSGRRPDKAIVHSGFYQPSWFDTSWDIPTMGVSTETEWIPLRYRVFRGFVAPWAPARYLHREYDKAAKNLPGFVHGYPHVDFDNNHRVPDLIHEWWSGGNEWFCGWMLA